MIQRAILLIAILFICTMITPISCSDYQGLPIVWVLEGTATTPAISNVQNGSMTTTAQWVSATVNQTAHNRVIYWYNIQENANSTVCGGTWSVPHPCADAYDSNWNTYGEDSGSHDVTLYVNYTVPSNAIREITKWQVKDYVISPQTTNLTVPEFCWDNPLQFKINITCNGVCSLLWYCYNGTDWHELRSVGSSRVYEEQMKWAYWSDWHNSTALPNITLSGLSSNTQYYYRMRSYNATNETLSSNTSTYDFTTAGIQYNISGFILNATGIGLSGATVSGNNSLGATVSGLDGNYSLGNATNGAYNISATLAGYTSNHTIVTIAGADETNKNITLVATSGGVETFVNPVWVLASGAFVLAAGWLAKRWGNRRRKRQ